MFCIIPHGCSGQITRTGMRFNAWGMTVSIGFPFAAAVTLMLFYDASGTIACLSAALFHEGGHLLCLKGCGETPRELRLGFAGMEMVRSKGQRLSFAQEVAAALSGPAANLFLFTLLSACGVWRRDARLLEAALVNLSLALFNLLPVSALDGGRALYFFLCRKYTMRTAHRVVTVLSALCLLPCAFFGFFLLLRSGYNISLLLAVGYLCFLLAARGVDF